MKVLLYSLFFIGATLAAHVGVGIPSLDSRIVGGDKANITDHPYHVSIRYSSNFLCNGAIIARTWILTTGSCAKMLPPNVINVRVGSSEFGTGGTIVWALNAVYHSKYDVLNHDYNIGLIRLEEPISLSETAQIVRLPNNGAAIPEGTLANVTGWRSPTDEEEHPTDFNVIEIPVMSNSVCRDLYSSHLVSERMFCAGLFEGGKDTCSRDGASPLVINNVLFGLASWSVGCALPGQPTVYTHVGVLRDWITEQTGI